MMSQGICSELPDRDQTTTQRITHTTPEELNKSSQELFNMGVTYHIEGQNEKAVALFIKSNIPLGLFNAAKFYQDGLVGKINEKPNMQRAAELYIQANTPDALCNLAFLYHAGHIGLKEDGTPNYEEAARLNQKSGVPLAKYNLGYMYHHGLIGTQNCKFDFKTAARFYRESKLPQALCNLGNLYRDGYIDGKPNYAKARELYNQSKHPNAMWNLGRLYRYGHLTPKRGSTSFEIAAKYYNIAGHAEALCDLATLYRRGYGLIDGKPNLKEAQRLYLASKMPEAYMNLGIMTFTGEIDCIDEKPDVKKAFNLFGQSSLIEAKVYRLFIIKYYYESIKIDYPLLQQNLIDLICKQLEINQKTAAPADSELILGLLAAYKNKDLEQALIHYTNALSLGSQISQLEIKRIKMLIKLQTKIEQETTETEEALISPPLMEPIEQSKPVIETETEVEKPKKYKPTKPVLSEAERLQLIMEKINKKILKIGKNVEVIDKDDVKPLAPLILTFIDDQVRKDYQVAPKKIKELLEDMQEKPYGTDGVGKPEVLKRKFKGYKGSISRRINDEDRLVYKVIEPRKIMILSCKGHYK
jgi:Txe/YoeB family toxin of toxin-antitoxin system